jgi:hypothetical protein
MSTYKTFFTPGYVTVKVTDHNPNKVNIISRRKGLKVTYRYL